MNQFFGNLREFVERYWAGTLLLFGTIAAVSLPLWFRLGHIPNGLSTTELALRHQIDSHAITLGALLHDPFFLPYKIGLYLLQFAPFHSAGSLRSVGALLGLVGIIGFYWMIRIWHTRRLAVLSTLLFACSAWLLHLTRYASFDSIYIFLLVIFASWTWVKAGTYPRLAFCLALLTTAFGLYIPGFIWFIVPALFWQRRTIRKAFSKMPLPILISILLLGILAIAPLVVSIIMPSAQASTLANIKELFALPEVFPSIKSVLTNLVNIPLQLFVISPSSSLLGVGRLPLLDIFTAAMVIIGAVNLAYNYKLDRTKIIFTVLLVGSILISLGGPMHISILLPFLYLLAAEGIAYLLSEWLTIFPRNPVARTTGVTVVSIVIVLSCAFQLFSYFVAWPHTEKARQTFTHHL